MRGVADNNFKDFLIKAIEFLIETVMKIKILLYLFLSLLTITIGCRAPMEPIIAKPAYDRALLPGQQALRKITNPLQIPDFTLASFDLQGLKPAIENSLNYLGKSSSRQYFPVSGITHQRASDSLKGFLGLLDSGLRGADLTFICQLAAITGEQYYILVITLLFSMVHSSPAHVLGIHCTNSRRIW